MVKIEPTETELLLLLNQTILLNAVSLLVISPLRDELKKAATRTTTYIQENYGLPSQNIEM